jgi:hypothetical protein
VFWSEVEAGSRKPRNNCEMTSLFNHLGGGGKKRLRKAETWRLGDLEIDHELEFGRLLDR